MTRMMIAATLAATCLVAPAAFAQTAVPPGRGAPSLTARDRQAQEAWWARRAMRHPRPRKAEFYDVPGQFGYLTHSYRM